MLRKPNLYPIFPVYLSPKGKEPTFLITKRFTLIYFPFSKSIVESLLTVTKSILQKTATPSEALHV
ncbi:hypothetical protein [Sulfurimonas sp.]|uniref:hypothetical protein n=1 Tax=Sulfurimonas sp. TaxID=2022749 RepID=UPI002B4A18CB|nr:hypothetical protein [Sulfurimonas sp.]